MARADSSTASNSSLQAAKAAKNDEFYTQISDIENELRHYKEHLKGKVVFCNCDDPEWSMFWKHFTKKFDDYQLAKVVATHYSRGMPSYKLEFTGNDKPVVKTPLRGDGDFSSDECVEILKSADIVITNPPFSLFRKYIAQLVEHKKGFLVIGNQNAITYKEIFKLIKSNQLWLGLTKPKQFAQPDGTMKAFGNICWFTNLPHNRRNQGLLLFRTYEGNEYTYPQYDNYAAIEVSRVTEIPSDYEGAMGVPITFLEKYNPEQFEIVGATESEGKGFSAGLWYASSGIAQPVVNGTRRYKRLFIKNKMPTTESSKE